MWPLTFKLHPCLTPLNKTPHIYLYICGVLFIYLFFPVSLRRLRGDLVYNKHAAQLNVFSCFSLLFAAVVCNGITNQPFVSFTDLYSFMQFAMQSMCSNSFFWFFVFFFAHAHCITWCSSAAALFILQSVFLKLKKKQKTVLTCQEGLLLYVLLFKFFDRLVF